MTFLPRAAPDTTVPESVAALEWQQRALCTQADPDSFFPEKGEPSEAKRVCIACPVRVDCLDYALANGEQFGIWGGLTETELRRVKNRRATLIRGKAAA